jgi:hypothetical protein
VPKFSVLGRFERDDILARVPSDYRGLVRIATKPDVMYTVILFPHDRSHGGVSTSALIRRALRRVEPNEAILAVGADFTREATELWEARNAAIARIGTFGWTDASYIGIRSPAR